MSDNLNHSDNELDPLTRHRLNKIDKDYYDQLSKNTRDLAIQSIMLGMIIGFILGVTVSAIVNRVF